MKQAYAVVGQYFAAAPTHAQAKKIFWDDLKAFTLSCLHPRKPSESDLIIYLPNGSEIHVLGLDKPQRIEGIPGRAAVSTSSRTSSLMPGKPTSFPR